MAARWMEAKVARMKPRNLRFVEAGTVKEARALSTRPEPMPENKHRDDELIAAAIANGMRITRGTCRGIMPHHSYGRVCKGHSRAGLNLNPISERTARERPHDFAPQGLLNWASEKRPWQLVKVTRG